MIGPVIFIHLVLVLTVLIGGGDAAWTDLQQYFVHLTPLAVMDMLIRQLALRRWRHPSIFVGPMWRAVTLIYITWPVYTLAWIMAVFHLPLSFRSTPKSPAGGLNPLWLFPQLATALLLVGGVVYSLVTIEEKGSFFLLFCFATCLAIPQLGLIRPLLRSILTSRRKSGSNSEVIPVSVVTGEQQF
jgi:hypothetical protein